MICQPSHPAFSQHSLKKPTFWQCQYKMKWHRPGLHHLVPMLPHVTMATASVDGPGSLWSCRQTPRLSHRHLWLSQGHPQLTHGHPWLSHGHPWPPQYHQGLPTPPLKAVGPEEMSRCRAGLRYVREITIKSTSSCPHSSTINGAVYPVYPSNTSCASVFAVLPSS